MEVRKITHLRNRSSSFVPHRNQVLKFLVVDLSRLLEIKQTRNVVFFLEFQIGLLVTKLVKEWVKQRLERS